jgi:hypothetical protein
LPQHLCGLKLAVAQCAQARLTDVPGVHTYDLPCLQCDSTVSADTQTADLQVRHVAGELSTFEPLLESSMAAEDFSFLAGENVTTTWHMVVEACYAAVLLPSCQPALHSGSGVQDMTLLGQSHKIPAQCTRISTTRGIWQLGSGRLSISRGLPAVHLSSMVQT